MPVNEKSAGGVKTKSKGMFIKTLVAVFGTIITCIILLKAPLWGTGILISFVSALMGFEFSVPTGLVKNRFIQVISVSFAAAIPWLIYFRSGIPVFAIILFAFAALCFYNAIFTKNGASLFEIISAIVSAFVFPLIISMFLALAYDEKGKHFLLLPLAIAWAGDAAAQITGMICGKHKLIERISPNKTVEGFFGGIGGSVLGVVIYSLVLHFNGTAVKIIPMIILGIFGSVISVFGDLSFSFIKRECGIKDFGKLIPEHGGVLDRFDSVLFALPLCYIAYPYLI